MSTPCHAEWYIGQVPVLHSLDFHNQSILWVSSSLLSSGHVQRNQQSLGIYHGAPSLDQVWPLLLSRASPYLQSHGLHYSLLAG